MIVVRIELYPNGNVTQARELQHLEIRNVGGTVAEGQYLVTLGEQTVALNKQPREQHPAQLVSNALHTLGFGPVRAPEPLDLSRIPASEEEDDSFDLSR